MQQHVILAGFLFGSEFKLGAREAGEIFAVPGGFADEAEGECAVGADGKAIAGFRKGRRVGTVLLADEVAVLGEFVPSRALTPLTGAVDCVAIGLEGFFALESDVALDCLGYYLDLDKLAGLQGLVFGSPCLGFCSTTVCLWDGRVAGAFRCKTLHTSNIALCYAGVIEILEAVDAEDVGT